MSVFAGRKVTVREQDSALRSSRFAGVGSLIGRRKSGGKIDAHQERRKRRRRSCRDGAQQCCAPTGSRLATQLPADLRWWRALVRGGWCRRRSRRGGGCGRGRDFAVVDFAAAEFSLAV